MTQRHEANEYSIPDAFTHLLDCLIRPSVSKWAAELSTNGREAGPALLNRKQAATYLGVSLSTFDDICRAGRVDTIYIDNNPRMPRFRRIDLDKYIRSLKPKPR